jgi:hypothetical protein
LICPTEPPVRIFWQIFRTQEHADKPLKPFAQGMSDCSTYL